MQSTPHKANSQYWPAASPHLVLHCESPWYKVLSYHQEEGKQWFLDRSVGVLPLLPPCI